VSEEQTDIDKVKLRMKTIGAMGDRIRELEKRLDDREQWRSAVERERSCLTALVYLVGKCPGRIQGHECECDNGDDPEGCPYYHETDRMTHQCWKRWAATGSPLIPNDT
jgi:hypothetical protein